MAGVVLIRQRPGTSKGVVFITIEDETGIANLVVWPAVFEKQRKIVMGARLMAVHGIIQRDPDSEVIHVVAGGPRGSYLPAQPPQRQFAAPQRLEKPDAPRQLGTAAQSPPTQRRNHPEKPRFPLIARSNAFIPTQAGGAIFAANQCYAGTMKRFLIALSGLAVALAPAPALAKSGSKDAGRTAPWRSSSAHAARACAAAW